jgi:LSD1 subclass zinc finger protein
MDNSSSMNLPSESDLLSSAPSQFYQSTMVHSPQHLAIPGSISEASASSVPGESAENDIEAGDCIMRSQLAILEQIQRANELRKRTVNKPAECFLPPVAFINIPTKHFDVDTKSVSSDPAVSVLSTQRRLLDRFRRQKEGGPKKQEDVKQGKTVKDSSKKSQLYNNHIVTACRPFYRKTNPLKVPTTASQRETDAPINCPDHYTKLGGKKYIVRGTDHTYKAIESGASTVIHCVACKRALQVPANAKAVYCTCCHHISPLVGKMPVPKV